MSIRVTRPPMPTLPPAPPVIIEGDTLIIGAGRPETSTGSTPYGDDSSSDTPAADAPATQDWMKNPVNIIIAVVVIVAGYLFVKRKG